MMLRESCLWDTTYVVVGVGEDDGPRITDPLVELLISHRPMVWIVNSTHPDLTDGSVGLFVSVPSQSSPGPRGRSHLKVRSGVT
jgi:hypothetical protein